MSLEIKNLTKKFGSHTAVNDLTFNVPKGTVFGLLGRNGAGKSTTIKQILGLLEPTAGEMFWNGQPIDQDKLSYGYLPEERGLYTKRRVDDQLMYYGRLEGMKKAEAAKAIDFWLNRLEIPEYKTKLVTELSKGNQQKIQLIATLLHDPELIILDEPFTGLDPVNVQIFIDIIKEEAAKGKTIIFSSHQMGIVEELCDDVILLKQGVDEVSGKLTQIKAGYGYKNLIFTNPSDRLVQLLEKLHFEPVVDRNRVTIRVENDKVAMDVLNAVTDAGISIPEFHLAMPTLQEIFVERIG